MNGKGGGGLYIALLSYYCKKERIAGDCNMTITVTKTFKSYSLLLVLGIKNDKIKKEDFLLLFGCYFWDSLSLSMGTASFTLKDHTSFSENVTIWWILCYS